MGPGRCFPARPLTPACARGKPVLAPPAEARKAHSYAGLDLAEGGANKCSLTIRSGPVVESRDRWPGVTGDLEAGCRAERTAASVHLSCL